MTRQDLRELSDEDLVSLSNRGNLNRARRDLDSGQYSCEIYAQGDEVIVSWSDPVTCVFPPGKTVTDAYCTCPASRLCRHMIRSILAYQQHTKLGDMAAWGPWDPGTIDDDVLKMAMSATQLRKAEQLVEDGIVVELLRSQKPSAKFQNLGHTVKFLVANDIRYAHCDCAGARPCVHAAAAILAFRGLDPEQVYGIVTTEDEGPRHNEHLRRCAHQLDRLAEHGVARAGTEVIDRLRGTQERLLQDGWVWPSDVVADICQAHALYAKHDARFSHEELARLFGEFAIRDDALAAPVIPVPRSYVQGSINDADTKLGPSRFIGLGCTARISRGHVDVLALLQDAAHGRVVAITHRFTEPRDEPDTSLAELGSRLVIRGRSMAHFGAGQIVMEQASLNHAHQLDLGRAQASVYAQGYKWEELQAPVLADGFDEISARLKSMAPASLRSRRIGEDVYVCRIKAVTDVMFSERTQSLSARLTSVDGSSGELWFGYNSRNSDGCERMLTWLTRHAEHLLFVAGVASSSPGGVVIEPTGLVFEVTDPTGTRRELIQPWVDSLDAFLETGTQTVGAVKDVNSALTTLRRQLAHCLGDVLLQGIREFSGWDELADIATRAASVGLTGISKALHTLCAQRTVQALTHATILNTLLQESA